MVVRTSKEKGIATFRCVLLDNLLL